MISLMLVMAAGAEVGGLDPTLVALIGTIMGGVGLKVAEHWLGKNRVKIDDAARIRDELRLENTTLREENRQLEVDVDSWKKQYYDLFQKHAGLETDLKLALFQQKKDEPKG